MSGCFQQDSGQRNRTPAPLMLIKKLQHWLEAETHWVGPTHSCSDIMVSPAVPTTPTTPRGASSRGRIEAVAAVLPRAADVVASRANPPLTTGKLTKKIL